LTDRWTNS